MRNGVRSALSMLLAGCVSSLAPLAVRAEATGEAAPPAAAEETAPAAPAVKSGTYVVQKGDTLSGLAKRCLGDARRWKEIHHTNPQVKDPNKIYPGDELALDCGGTGGGKAVASATSVTSESSTTTTTTTATAEPAPAASAEAAAPSASKPAAGGSSATAFRVTESQYAFIAENRELPVAYLAGNIDGLHHYGQNQRVYLNAGKNTEFQVGDRFSIYRDTDVVIHPISGAKLGYMTRILGDLVIEEVSEESSIGRIVDAYETVNPGDRLQPYVDVSTAVSPVDSERALNGTIVGTPAEPLDLVERRSIFVDRGKHDGVKQGNVLSILRPGGVTADPVTGHELKLAPEVIGKAIVFHVDDSTSSAWVFQSKRNLHLGDTVSFE